MQKLKAMLALLLLAALVAPILISAASVVGEQKETIVRVAYIADINTLNPFYWTTVADLDLLRIIYDTPFRIGPDGRLKPGLVQSYEFSDDGKTITFHLVKNATWHDGTPVTAEDLAYTLEFVRDHRLPYLGSVGEVIDKVEVVDKYTVKVTLKHPFSPLPLIMADIFLVVPKHVWEKIENPKQYTNENPVGSGPFKLVERKPGEYILLERNPNYFMGAPKVDKLLIKIITSADAQILALKSKELDMIELQPGPAVKELEKEPNIKIITAPSTYIYYIDFNLRRYPMNVTEFRVAIAHAIDKQKIVDTVLYGYGQVAHSHMVPGLSQWYNPNVPKYEYNPEKAKQILDKLGIKDVDGDGWRELPNGTDLVLKMPTINSGIWPRLSEVVASMIEAIGIKVSVEPAEAGAVFNTLLNTWDFDINVLGWRLYFDPDPYIYESFHSSRIGPGGLNWVGYSNPEVDELLEKQRTAVDPEERRQLLFKVQEILARDLPWIPLAYPDMIYAVRTDTFKGWVPIPRYGLRNVYSWISLEPVEAVETTTPAPSPTTPVETTPAGGVPAGAIAAVVAIVAVALVVLLIKRR